MRQGDGRQTPPGILKPVLTPADHQSRRREPPVGRIDRELMDRAAWVPLVTPYTTVSVSAQVGNYQDTPQLQYALLDQLWVN
jgi:hypothetical protein